MLESALKTLSDNIDTSFGSRFTNRWHLVKRVTRNESENSYTLPLGWCEGQQDGKPLLNDYDLEYFYLRTVGEMTSEAETIRTSSKKTITDSVPIRLVMHVREPMYKADQYAVVARQLIGAYRLTSTTGVKIWTEVTGSNTDSLDLLAEETTKPTYPPDGTMLFSVDFDLFLQYQPSTSCIIGGEDICTLQDVTQVPLCKPVTVTDTDATVTEVPSGGSFTCTNPNTQMANAVEWDAATLVNMQIDGSYLSFNVNTLEKISGASSYDSLCYGLNPISDGQYVESAMEWVHMGRISFGIHGNNVDPLAAGLYPPQFDAGFTYRTESQGRVEIVDAGAVAGAVNGFLTNYNPRTVLRLEYVSGTIRYLIDGSLVYSYSYGLGATLYPTCLLWNIGDRMLVVKQGTI